MRSEFEKYIREQSGFTSDFQVGCNDQYKSNLMHFMFTIWQHQQSKVDELNQELHLVLNNWNDLTRAIHARTNGTAVAEARQLYEKVDELQKRLDAVVIEIEKLHLSGVIGFGTVKKLEQALKGGGE